MPLDQDAIKARFAASFANEPAGASAGSPVRWAVVRRWTQDLDRFGFVDDRARHAILFLLGLLDEYADALLSMVGQHCTVYCENDIVTHAGLSANEDAFSLLEDDSLLEPLHRGYLLRWDNLPGTDTGGAS